MSTFARTTVIDSAQAGPLSAFLDGRLQAWRAPILLAGGGLQVLRGGKAVTPLTLASVLLAGDVVTIDDAANQCYPALRKEASANFRDYVFSKPAASDSFHTAMLAVMARRPRTVMLDKSIVDLVKLVHRLVLVGTLPIRHIVIVSHASTFGNLQIAQSRDIDAITWETLVAAVADKTLRIDMEERNRMGALLPRPEDSNGLRIPAALIIRGCNVGRVTPFLDKLREALGPMIDVVVAPKFASAAALFPSTDVPTYAVEYMQEDFFVYSDHTLSRDELISACQARKFTTWDGKPVKDSAWTSWIPDAKKMHLDSVIVSTAAIEAILPVPLVPRQRIHAYYEYQLDENPLILPLEPALTQADLKPAFRAYMQRKPKRDEFPLYRQWGYASDEELIDGFSYAFKAEQSGANRYDIVMTRHVYEIRVPITNAQSALICNFYPKDGAPVLMLDENDDTFFGRSAAIPDHFAQRI